MYGQNYNKPYTKYKVAFLSLCIVMALEMDLKTMQGNNGLQDCDDTTETLSLCDLPLNSFASDLDDFSREERSPSFDHDLFEFFSEDFTASTCSDSRDAIFFCGKLIPHKGTEVAADTAHGRELTSIPGNRKGGSYSLRKLRKSTDKHDHLGPMKKISILASPIKSRCYLFTVGVGKFPMEMKLSDMKMRQSRRNPSNKFQHDNRCEFVKRGSANKAKGLWSLLKVWVARVNKLVL